MLLMPSGWVLQALVDAGLEKGSEAFEKIDKTRAGVLIGSGMGGLTVFQDGVKNLVEKGYKKITPFFIPYAITNMCGCCHAPLASPTLVSPCPSALT
jgi:3-oxoacyl-(acyl-carrier-protein) synthase